MNLQNRRFITALATTLAVLTSAMPARAHAASQTETRNFYDVLGDLLSDFEYDLKNGSVSGLKDLAIRNIAMSENIPPSFRNHLELVVTEKILATTKTRVVQCLPCRARKATLNQDQILVTSAELNPNELARIAKAQGIENFMDLAFSFQPTGMVLSMTTADAATGSVVWSRSYNSETSRASAYRRGVDFSQMEASVKQNEYIPTLQYRGTISYLNEPDAGERSSCLSLGFRLVERYDNRKKEVGFELDYITDVRTLSGSPVESTTTDTGARIYGSFNMTMLFVHAWNLIGAEENYNQVRGTIVTGVGGTYASGYLGGVFRAGYEWRLAKHWAVSTTLGYRPKATTLITGTEKSVSGIEYGLGISALF
ncbi:MAG: hypothetical protein JST04_11140 [Bdellovibrionales bacterium]|nr:hypothetical protein [Bdellovibrionales bacterium]